MSQQEQQKITVQHDARVTGHASSDLAAKTYVRSPEGYLELYDDENNVVATFAPGGWVGVYFAGQVIRSTYGEEAR